MISVTAPIQQAFASMQRILFRPFSLEKWVTLGFCAFLAFLGQGGGVSFQNLGQMVPDGHSRRGPGIPGMTDWMHAHLPLLIGLGILVLLVVLLILLLVMWLNSRGQFMFLDGVVQDRGAVIEPWKRYRKQAHSLFGFTLALEALFLLGLAAIGGMAWLLARQDIAARTFGPGAILAVGLGGVLLLLLLLAFGVVTTTLQTFIVPVMYRREIGTLEAIRVFRQEILPGHLGKIVGFLAMQWLLSIAAGILITLVTCATCCIAGIPFVSSVVFLPIFVFFRCYSLHFLAQFGEEWRLLDAPDEPQSA